VDNARSVVFSCSDARDPLKVSGVAVYRVFRTERSGFELRESSGEAGRRFPEVEVKSKMLRRRTLGQASSGTFRSGQAAYRPPQSVTW
jgi:hypothetical protein